VIVLRDPPAALDELYRESHPWNVTRGIPLHVTVLFPWVPRDELRPEHVERLRAVCARHRPFELRLTGLGEFPGVLWAVPAPDDVVRALLRDVHAAFPEHPPYEGEFAGEVTPHATLAELDDGADQPARADALRTRLDPLVPVAFGVDAVTILEEAEPDRWREREDVPLGA
jgi:2'-5' RNA ligase